MREETNNRRHVLTISIRCQLLPKQYVLQTNV